MKRAFTLIELLVVIAIIAILAAILFPVFAQAKAAAKDSAALSNAKQLGLGILMYSGDSDDALPLAVQRGRPLGYWQTFNWQHSVQPYKKNWDLGRHPKLDPYRIEDRFFAIDADFSEYARGYFLGQEWGVLPTPSGSAALKAANTTRYVAWSSWPVRNSGRALFDGFFGAGAEPADPFGYTNAASVSATQIPNVSQTVMVGESGGWGCGIDAVATSGDNDVLGYYVNGSWFTLGGSDRFAGKANFAGFHARKTVGKTSGLGFDPNDATVKIEGLTTYVAFDGSAKTMPFGKLYSRADAPSGKVLRYQSMEDVQ